MDSISSADAKARFDEIIAQAEAGEPVTITREGRPVAVVSRAEQPEIVKKKIDVDALRAFTAGMPFQEESAGEFMRKLRESDRY